MDEGSLEIVAKLSDRLSFIRADIEDFGAGRYGQATHVSEWINAQAIGRSKLNPQPEESALHHRLHWDDDAFRCGHDKALRIHGSFSLVGWLSPAALVAPPSKLQSVEASDRLTAKGVGYERFQDWRQAAILARVSLFGNPAFDQTLDPAKRIVSIGVEGRSSVHSELDAAPAQLDGGNDVIVEDTVAFGMDANNDQEFRAWIAERSPERSYGPSMRSTRALVPAQDADTDRHATIDRYRLVTVPH